MLNKNQIVKVKWNSKIKKHYENLGYEYTKMGNEFEVKFEDLTKTSKAYITLICDYCGKEFQVMYYNYVYQNKENIIKKDSCLECRNKKVIESNQLIYGVNCTTQIKEVRERQIETLFNNYGVTNPVNSEEIMNKIKNTNIEKYGVESPLENEEIRNKAKQSNLNKIGVEFPFQSPDIVEKVKDTHFKKYGCLNPANNLEIKKKIIQTNLKKYGVENVFSNEEIKAKIRISLFKNGTTPTSKQQEYLCNLYKGVLNYPIKKWSLDIAFPNEMIYIEYQGGGHNLSVILGSETSEEFELRNVIRNNILKREGWKRIELVSNLDKLPKDEILLDIIQYSKNIFDMGRSWIIFDIDNNLIKYKENIIEYNFEKLRKV